jgi:tRNA pseudouridine13 synthase
MSSLPDPVYLTKDLPGTGGLIKQHLEDFRVEEIPAYPAAGVGTHCYLQIEKRGFSTMAAADILAKALGRKNMDIGYAGLKDKQAITTQWFSVEHLDTSRAKVLQTEGLPTGMKVVGITRHNNKIKRGHLAGNRFIIKIRNPEWARAGFSLDEPAKRAQAILESLKKTGVPNFFGPQRFGMRKDNHMLGLALITGDAKAFTDRFLGDPDESVDHGGVLAARQSFKKRNYENALHQWPGHLRDERAALSAMVRAKGNPKRAMFAVDMKLKQLLVAAFQSYLFNKVLERRLPKMTIVLPGDYCEKHENGAAFLVPADPDAAAKEQPRADAHEISPTGPLFGSRMSKPESIVGVMEEEVLKEFNLTPASFDGEGGKGMSAPGGRRSLRLFPTELSLATGDDHRGPFLELAFTLPSGSYATVLLGEVMKTDITID